MAPSRRPIFFKDKTGPIEVDADLSAVHQFHRQLPKYVQTPLISLDDAAKRLKVKSVFVKDESSRLGLPAFKILGASWGSCRAIIAKTGIPTDSPLDKIALAAQKEGIVLFTASAGNHGRALAVMARILGIQACIYVPRTVNAEAIRLISSEGAKVTVSKKDYDGAMIEAWDAASTTQGGLFVQDTAFDSYEEIPKWIVEGYSTLLSEAEEQLQEQGLKASLVITPVGVGSLAHAVVRHCKSRDRKCAVMSVEPDTAACLYKSLVAGKSTPVVTTKTTMEGMNCGTLSSTVFKDLQTGVDASATISDYESHEAIQYLAERSVNSGPCGGAALAALWRLADFPKRPGWLHEDAVILILSTEGLREYEVPMDVSSDDAVGLTQILKTINSSEPDLSRAAGAGGTSIANYINAWLEHRGLESNWVKAQSGRSPVDGVCLGTEADVATELAAMAKMASSGNRPNGDVTLTAIADEEKLSEGT
ncbi:putative diaminopropionate ammonia-lyase [Lizonia empirigonia]|nr:putative diaminopropionate ammonia-lyase [Lizonia empirigonia]